MFNQIESEQNGRLDILINNAYKGVNVNSSYLIIVYFFLNNKILKYTEHFWELFIKILGNETRNMGWY